MRYLKGVNTLEYEGTSFHAPGIGKSYKGIWFCRTYSEVHTEEDALTCTLESDLYFKKIARNSYIVFK